MVPQPYSSNGTERGEKPIELFQGLTNPVPGNLYMAHWPRSNEWYAVLLLPTGNMKTAGLEGSLIDKGLMVDLPKCYRRNREKGTIGGWRKNYEDGGSLVEKRYFPVMYLDDSWYVYFLGCIFVIIC